MAQVFPFRAYRYNPARAPFERVLTQPYDKISPAMQEKYYAADPHNLIAIEKGHSHPDDTPQNNVYTRATASLEDWIRNGIVQQDPGPSFYAYSQEYTVPGTEQRRTRRGFIGAGQLEDYSARVVFRHEQTLSGPKADRLELLRHTQTHTGQLFMLYSDPQRRVEEILTEAETSAPETELRDEYGVTHRLWIISRPERVAAIQKAMQDQKLVIADGHHRYETALAYRNEYRGRAGRIDPEAPFERVMMTFINTHSEGLTILPTHRVASHIHDFSWPAVRRHLEPWFAAEEFPFSNDAQKAEARKKALACLANARTLHQVSVSNAAAGGNVSATNAATRHDAGARIRSGRDVGVSDGVATRAIGVYPAEESSRRTFYVLTLRDGVNLAELLPSVSPLQRELDVVLLHEGILEPALGITPQAVTAEAHLTYEREAAAAIEAVDSGHAQISFLLNPCAVDQVMKIATAGEVLPQKSTDFYPKLLSGITMYRLA
ncbi:MAG TPA: DUF1015 domain-containing protein [Candidatus Acidoferrum sp.]|nr:DUF1015 domain-containing protein [Candidatus Acidoferrum sp.]